LKTLVAVILVGLAASPALARQSPPPPPSGIVVHLFGQNSVMSQIMPTPSATAPGKQTDNGTGQSKGGVTQNAAEPTFGGILHQMFVTGDPADKTPNFAPGRKGAF
jgi:hypothetical protein